MYPGILSSELAHSGYNFFRCDRKTSSVNSWGGGALVAVKTNLRCQFVFSCDDLYEQVSILLFHGNSQLLISAIYIQPNSSEQVYEKCSRSLIELKRNFGEADFIVAGDFNLPHVRWFNSLICSKHLFCSNTSSLTKKCCQTLLYCINFLNLFQLNNVFNIYQSTLDLVFSSVCNIDIQPASDVLIDIDLFHPPLFGFCLLSSDRASCPALSTRNFFKADYQSCVYFLNSINWYSVLSHENVNEDVDCFLEILNDCIARFVPWRQPKSDTFPDWFSGDLKKLVFEKKKAHKRFKVTRSPTDYETFSYYRTLVKRQSHISYLNFCEKTERNIRANPKGFFNFVNNLRQDNVIPESVSFHDRQSTNDSETCNLFADFFRSVYSPVVNRTFSSPISDTTVNLNAIYLSLESIFESLTHLKSNSGPGPDLIPNFFLKNCVYAITTPLHILFNKSLATGIFPDSWKTSRIIPIFKSGDKTNVVNYRPISIINSIPKLFEQLVTPHVYNAFKSMIIDEQHGFVERKSTISNLATIEGVITESIENRGQVDVVYTDFAKAFDKVPHDVLLAKLGQLGIGNPLLSWLSTYLCNRRQLVGLKGAASTEFTVTSGVPQGSHLGPLLFVIFINDLSSYLNHSHILLYADDAKIYRTINSVSDAILLQNDLQSFDRWCDDNFMSVNVAKCHVVRYTRKKHNSRILFNYQIRQTPLSILDETVDLGVTFSSDGSFHAHVVNTANKALRILGFVIRNTQHFRNPSTLILLFNTLVRPILEYGSPVWTPSSAIDKKVLESVQSKFLRKLAFVNMSPMRFDEHDYTHIKNQFGIQSLETRRNIADLLLLYKILHGLVDSSNLLSSIKLHVPSRQVRHSQLFAIPFARTNLMANSLLSRLHKLGNVISDTVDIFSTSLASYSKSVNDLYRF